MTRRTQVVLQDDIDGSEPASTVTFSLNGRTYEIDLSASHRAELDAALAPWISHARRVGRSGVPQPRAGGSQGGDEPDPAEIRRWAQAEGIPVRERGRLPQELRSRYEEAHDGTRSLAG